MTASLNDRIAYRLSRMGHKKLYTLSHDIIDNMIVNEAYGALAALMIEQLGSADAAQLVDEPVN